MNDHEAERIAAAMHELRPDWPAASLLTLIRKSLIDKPRRDVTVALAWIACESASHTPARVLESGPWWRAAAVDAPTDARPEKLDRHERCTVCSHSREACRLRWAGDHEFTTVADIAKDQFDPAALLADVKTTVAAAKLAPEPERPGLAEVVENSPRIAEMKRATRAAQTALAQEREGAGA